MAEFTLRELGDLLTNRRSQLGLSAREVARRADVEVSVVLRLERAANPTPRMENLLAIGEVLGIPAADLYAALGAVPVGQLPSLRPYMRAKYRALPDEALTEVELFISDLSKRYRSGPRDHEDEH